MGQTDLMSEIWSWAPLLYVLPRFDCSIIISVLSAATLHFSCAPWLGFGRSSGRSWVVIHASCSSSPVILSAKELTLVVIRVSLPQRTVPFVIVANDVTQPVYKPSHQAVLVVAAWSADMTSLPHVLESSYKLASCFKSVRAISLLTLTLSPE